MSHTHGPWSVATVNTPLLKDVDAIVVPSLSDGMLNTLFVVEPGAIWGRSLEEAKANAKLIAAAPELLEAITGLFEHCAMIHKHWGDGDNRQQADAAIATARAAIAKATE